MEHASDKSSQQRSYEQIKQMLVPIKQIQNEYNYYKIIYLANTLVN